jgi:PTH1 family peptidyl-tRNA hydrolase
MENLHLVAGLGNPGGKYSGTRHNAGFMAVETLAQRWRADWRRDEGFDARLARAEFDGRQVLLCQPQTFMNLSGECVGKLAGYYRVAMIRLLIVVDDADLPLGEVRLRSRGSPGGHHGLESVEQHLGTDRYPRLRIGIGRANDGRREIADFVLGKFGQAEMETVTKVLERVAAQVECWVTSGVARAMSQYNGAVEGTGAKK